MLKDPVKIEKKSMDLIAKQMKGFSFTKEEGQIAQRVVHATADLDFLETLQFSPTGIERGLKALLRGVSIVTDVRMVLVGINPSLLELFGCQVNCYIHDDDVKERAKEEGVTRSILAMDKAIALPENTIFIIGNTPTALFHLLHHMERGEIQPDLIIGAPVGFVGAEESKAELAKTKAPFIACHGKKGGSSVAVAIINALLLLALERSKS